MATFGERTGLKPMTLLRVGEAPPRLRMAIWNAVEPWLFDDRYSDEYTDRLRALYRHLHWPVDTVMRSRIAGQRVRKYLLEVMDPVEVFEFAEYCAALRGMGQPGYEAKQRATAHYMAEIDRVMEANGAPVRFVNYELCPLTNETEIAEVERAASGGGVFGPAHEHIAQAISHFSQTPEPAYEDSIKQSISAVESVLRIATGDEKGKMGALLKSFESAHGDLHPSLRAAIDKLYGYASDEEGIRHGATKPSTVGDAEARCMLVMCSALVNFLIQKSGAVP